MLTIKVLKNIKNLNTPFSLRNKNKNIFTTLILAENTNYQQLNITSFLLFLNWCQLHYKKEKV